MPSFESQAWFAEAVRYFRAFGFFATHRLESDDGLAALIRSHWLGDWDEYLSGVADHQSADQLLLVADTSRVWWRDLEGVYRGSNYYADALREWAAISRGQFAPEQISEMWQSDAGPVNVAFTQAGQRHTFEHTGGDFLDHGLIQLVNRCLALTPLRYEVATDFGDSNWIAVLSPAEKARLKSERGWHFLW